MLPLLLKSSAKISGFSGYSTKRAKMRPVTLELSETALLKSDEICSKHSHWLETAALKGAPNETFRPSGLGEIAQLERWRHAVRYDHPYA